MSSDYDLTQAWQHGDDETSSAAFRRDLHRCLAASARAASVYGALLTSAICLGTVAPLINPLSAEEIHPPKVLVQKLPATAVNTVTAQQDNMNNHDQPARPVYLDQPFSMYVIRNSVSEIVRKMRYRIGPRFRWSYPTENIFLEPTVSIDTRGKTLTIADILDLTCHQAGVTWRMRGNVIMFGIPLTAEETQTKQDIWLNDQIDFNDRIRAARALAHDFDTDAMLWLFRQMNGKTIEEITDTNLNFIGRRIRSIFNAKGLASTYLLVGDHPEVVAVVEDLLKKDWNFGITMAIAAGVQGVETSITERFLREGLDAQVSPDVQDRYRMKLEDHFLGDVSSEASVTRLIKTLATAEGSFRKRLIQTVALHKSDSVDVVLADIATSSLNSIRSQVTTILPDSNAMSDFQLSCEALLRRKEAGWQDHMINIFNDKEFIDALPEAALVHFISLLLWDNSAESAAILFDYAIAYQPSSDAAPTGRSSSSSEQVDIADTAFSTLANRVDSHALQAMRDLFQSENQFAVSRAAAILSFRHDEEATRWIADQVIQGDNAKITSLYRSRLPWVPELMETVILNGDAETWQEAFNFYRNRAHRSREVDALASQFAVRDGPMERRLAAMKSMSSSTGRSNKDYWQALQILADDPSADIRQRATELLGGFVYNFHQENRLFIIDKARSGHIEAAAQLQNIMSRTKGAEREALLNAAAELAQSDNKQVQAVLFEQLGHISTHADGLQQQQLFQVMIQVAETGNPQQKAAAIDAMQGVWGESKKKLQQAIPTTASYYDEVFQRRRRAPSQNNERPEEKRGPASGEGLF